MNRYTRYALRLVIKIILFMVLFIVYRMVIMKGDIINIATLGIDIVVGIVIASLINAVIDEIPLLDPDKELYDKLRQGTLKMYEEAIEKTKQSRK